MRTIEEIKTWFENAKYEESKGITHPGQRGAMIGTLNRACGGEENRKLFLKAMFGVTSSKDLINGDWWVLKQFIGNSKFGDVWLPREDFEAECKLVLQKQADQDGQMKMGL